MEDQLEELINDFECARAASNWPKVEELLRVARIQLSSNAAIRRDLVPVQTLLALLRAPDASEGVLQEVRLVLRLLFDAPLVDFGSILATCDGVSIHP